MRELIATGRARLFAVIVTLGLLGLVALGITYTSLFHARHIDVEGERTLRTAEVLRMAGVDHGTNVFHLDPSAVEGALRSSPWIADAVVERDLPSTIRIRITEREPVAQVSVDGLAQSVAGDGTLLPGGNPSSLPEVRASVGPLDAEGRTSGARALAALRPQIRSRVRAVVVATDGSLTIHLDPDLDVVYGAPGEETAKAAALDAVLAWAEDGDVSLVSIDLSVPIAPTATTADGGSVTP